MPQGRADPMSVEARLLALLRCPLTQQTLTLASADLLTSLAAGRPLEGALVRADGAVWYPICDGIPVLLAEAAQGVGAPPPQV